MEPTVEGRLNWRFTTRSSEIFTKVFAHNVREQSDINVISPPMVPPHVWPQDPEEIVKRKSRIISAIGSRESTLEFHKRRTEILDQIQSDKSDQIDVYGKGRNFIDKKSIGLNPYRYSIAIENSISRNYWTEKLSDCFVSMTVPIYLGAPNILEFFPKESMIIVNEIDLSENLDDLLDRLSEEDYRSRVPFLLESRKLVLQQYNFGVRVGQLLRETLANCKGEKSFSRVWTIDSVVYLFVRMLLAVKKTLKAWTKSAKNRKVSL
jgi:hypothetical protein